MEVGEEEIIRFPMGIFAFEDERSFVLIKKAGPAAYLQSTSGEDPRFVVFEPGDIVEGYKPAIPKDVMKTLGADSEEELRLYVIAVVPENIRKMTVNLKSPVVVNMKKRLAMQVILEDGAYPVRFGVFD